MSHEGCRLALTVSKSRSKYPKLYDLPRKEAREILFNRGQMAAGAMADAHLASRLKYKVPASSLWRAMASSGANREDGLLLANLFVAQIEQGMRPSMKNMATVHALGCAALVGHPGLFTYAATAYKGRQSGGFDYMMMGVGGEPKESNLDACVFLGNLSPWPEITALVTPNDCPAIALGKAAYHNRYDEAFDLVEQISEADLQAINLVLLASICIAGRGSMSDRRRLIMTIIARCEAILPGWATPANVLAFLAFADKEAFLKDARDRPHDAIPIHLVMLAEDCEFAASKPIVDVVTFIAIYSLGAREKLEAMFGGELPPWCEQALNMNVHDIAAAEAEVEAGEGLTAVGSVGLGPGTWARAIPMGHRGRMRTHGDLTVADGEGFMNLPTVPSSSAAFLGKLVGLGIVPAGLAVSIACHSGFEVAGLDHTTDGPDRCRFCQMIASRDESIAAKLMRWVNQGKYGALEHAVETGRLDGDADDEVRRGEELYGTHRFFPSWEGASVKPPKERQSAGAPLAFDWAVMVPPYTRDIKKVRLSLAYKALKKGRYNWARLLVPADEDMTARLCTLVASANADNAHMIEWIAANCRVDRETVAVQYQRLLDTVKALAGLVL